VYGDGSEKWNKMSIIRFSYAEYYVVLEAIVFHSQFYDSLREN
jgi:hypothetical protein